MIYKISAYFYRYCKFCPFFDIFCGRKKKPAKNLVIRLRQGLHINNYLVLFPLFLQLFFYDRNAVKQTLIFEYH